MQAVKRVARKVIVTPSPSACAVLAWRRLNQGWQEDLHSIAPIYIRRSDAEEKRSAGQGENRIRGTLFLNDHSFVEMPKNPGLRPASAGHPELRVQAS